MPTRAGSSDFLLICYGSLLESWRQLSERGQSRIPSTGVGLMGQDRGEGIESFLSLGAHSVLRGAIHLLLIDEDHLSTELGGHVRVMGMCLGDS